MGKAGKWGSGGVNLEIRNSGTSGSELWTQRSREIETEPRARSLRGVNGEAGSWEKAGVDLEIRNSGTNRPKLSKRRGEASIREMGKAGKGFSRNIFRGGLARRSLGVGGGPRLHQAPLICVHPCSSVVEPTRSHHPPEACYGILHVSRLPASGSPPPVATRMISASFHSDRGRTATNSPRHITPIVSHRPSSSGR